MLSNTAVPKYYGEFRDKVLRGEIAVNRYVSMEMNRIDSLIRDPAIYYDDKAVEGWIKFCEKELTLVDGSDLHLLDTFKLWGEEIYGWYYFIDRAVWVRDRNGGHFETRKIRKRLVNKQYLIIGRGAAKSLYDTSHQAHWLVNKTETTQQITTAPTMKQSDEVMSPLRTAITRHRGPFFKFLTMGSIQNTTGNRATRPKLCSTKMGIQNFMTNSILEVRPMTIDKLQGSRACIVTIDEWLSGDVREDVVGAVEQGASKNDDYLIICTSSEGTVRNGPGDTIKMELLSILKGEYYNPHVSIWWYRLDDVNEVSDPKMWVKANPNIGLTVTYETYQQEVERAENAPSTRNDTLAKRFGIPAEGYTYFFTYEETLRHRRRAYRKMACSLGADLSQGDDFCAFTFIFPLRGDMFGIKTRSYITRRTFDLLSPAMHQKYEEFIQEGSLIVLEGVVLDIDEVYEDLDKYITANEYEVLSFGYDPYNADVFVGRWVTEYGQYATEVVRQGVRTESVPLGELKKLAEDRALLFDESLMQFTMSNCVVAEDTNGNRKLLKKRREEKIDNVAAMMDAYVAYKLHTDLFV